MYKLDDTIAAVSSPTADKRVIIRITGPQALNVLKSIFTADRELFKVGIYAGKVTIDDLQIDAMAYLFISPYSYTGQDLGELHFYSCGVLTEAVMHKILSSGTRLAAAGEFTARAYLNGKMDLAQAEAVNEVIVSSNILQLKAAEKLLAGKLGDEVKKISEDIIDILGLIEAGLDFSTEDIEVISISDAVAKLGDIKTSLENLLAGRRADESIIDLPSIGIAGVPNAGKSSLLNCLLGTHRSIVSDVRKTTRDVLTGIADSKNGKYVLFDCAGLIIKPENILDQLAQKAAVEAIKESNAVLFCVDISKEDLTEDLQIKHLIEQKRIIYIATKADLAQTPAAEQKLNILKEKFGSDFISISVNTKHGINELRQRIDNQLLDMKTASNDKISFSQISGIALTARHKMKIEDTIYNIEQAIEDVKKGSDEVAAMMLRAAYECISDIEQQSVEDKILKNIFGRFCIGK